MSYVEIEYLVPMQIRLAMDHFTWNLFFSWLRIWIIWRLVWNVFFQYLITQLVI